MYPACKMHVKILLIVLVFLMNYVVGNNECIGSPEYIGEKCSAVGVYRSVLGVSITDCEGLCANDPACKTINYQRIPPKCEFSGSTIPFSKLTWCPGYFYKNVNGEPTEADPCHSVSCRWDQQCDVGQDGVGRCIAAYCESPPSLPNAAIEPGRSHVGNGRMYICSSGYAPVPYKSNMTTVCTNDGSWSTADFSCATACPPVLPALDHSIVEEGDRIVGAVRNYTCTPGYALNPTISFGTVTCFAQNTWALPDFQCTRVCVDPLPSIENGTIAAGDSFVKISRSIVCNSGHRIRPIGQPGLVNCTENGWTGHELSCGAEVCIMELTNETTFDASLTIYLIHQIVTSLENCLMACLYLQTCTKAKYVPVSGGLCGVENMPLPDTSIPLNGFTIYRYSKICV